MIVIKLMCIQGSQSFLISIKCDCLSFLPYQVVMNKIYGIIEEFVYT